MRQYPLAVGVCIAIATLASAAQAQQTAPSAPAWSALAPRADVPRKMPFAPLEIMTLWALRAPFGLFSQTANPAALAWELDVTRTDYSLEHNDESGNYRRPLDASRSSVTALGASGAARAAGDGRVIGGILAERGRLSPGPRVDQAQPHGSSPLVLADTTAAPLSEAAVRLAAAGGWSVGRWAAGVSGAYDTEKLNTNRAGFVRQTQITTPGLIVGSAARLGTPLQLVFGIHAGVRRQAQTTDLAEIAAQGQLHQLQGFRDVFAIEVQQAYYQRFDERTQFVGAELAGEFARTRWVLGTELSKRRDVTTHAQQTAQLIDRWSADGNVLTGGAEHAFGARLIRVGVRSANVRGALLMSADSTGPSLRSHERLTTGHVEFRTPIGARMTALFTVAALDMRLLRQDTVLGVRLNLLWRDPSIAASATYSISSRGTALVGVSRAWHNAAGEVPRAPDRGFAYQSYVAPEIAIYASPATATSLQAGFRYQFTGALATQLIAEQASVSPLSFPVVRERPAGNRSARRATVTISVLPPQ